MKCLRPGSLARLLTGIYGLDVGFFHLDRDRASEVPSFAHIEMVRVFAADCISRSRIALIGIAYATAAPIA